jgi:hypothetical protein
MEVIIGYLWGIIPAFVRKTREKPRKNQSAESVSMLRFEPGTSHDHFAVMFGMAVKEATKEASVMNILSW